MHGTEVEERLDTIAESVRRFEDGLSALEVHLERIEARLDYIAEALAEGEMHHA